MKRLFFSAAIAVLSFTPAGNVQAQLVPAAITDTVWYQDTGSISGINSAMIEFTDNSLSPAVNWLMVEAYYGSNIAGGVVFRDRAYNTTTVWDYADPSFSHNTIIWGSPDIIVGNSQTNPGTDFLVAVAYIEFVASLNTWRYTIDYFTVSYSGPGTFNVTYNGNTTWPTAPTMSPFTIHLDVIAESNNTGTTGYPWCDKFVVVWDDLIWGATQVYAWQGSLNAPPATLSNTDPGVQQISPNVTPPATPYFLRPDVAAVQRGGGCAMCPIEDFALVTYLGRNMTTLHYDEWNITSSGVTTNPVWYSVIGTLNWPRIDGPDDFNINDPASGNAYVKVCAAVNSGSNLSYTFDPILASIIPPGNFFDNGGAAGLTNVGTSAIAFGPNGQTQYAVVHDANDAGMPAVRDIYMEPIDWTNSTVIAPQPVFPFATNWFEVNNTALMGMNGSFLTAISTPCNNPAALTLASWSTYDNTNNTSFVNYKISDYTLAGAGYSFKGSPRLPHEAAATSSFGLHPNPASASITLNAGLPTGTYAITDMMGRILLSGTVSGTKQSINISQLPSGHYIIKAGGNTGKFVKQ